ncbi:MAG: protein-glutamate O-methyltransferase CheR [Archaeoglobaceae archaeon]|nr:protein-glutamate O-methyltransferase CheR [Archaeoglobaceae archaeon]
MILKAILGYASKRSGLKLEMYRENYIRRRVELRMRLLGLRSFSDYFSYIKNNDREVEELVNTIAINVTEFMRDYTPFKFFMDRILPELSEKKLLRFWSAGCSFGEEAYSIAICTFESTNSNFTVYATDIDEDCLKRAEIGIYNESQLKNLDEDMKRKYFERVGDKLKIKEFVRKRVRFKKHDLTSQEPVTRFLDTIFCRNVMIYFTEDQKFKVLKDFHSALLSRGYLIIGKSETIPKLGFECVSLSEKVYRKV